MPYLTHSAILGEAMPIPMYDSDCLLKSLLIIPEGKTDFAETELKTFTDKNLSGTMK